MSGPRYIQSPAALSDPSMIDAGVPPLGAPVPFQAATFKEVDEENVDFSDPATRKALVPPVEVGAVVKRPAPLSADEAERIRKQELKREQDDAMRAAGQLGEQLSIDDF